MLIVSIAVGMKWGIFRGLGVAIRSKLLPDYDSACNRNNLILGKLHES
jgi:hypothetical protein